MAPARAYDLIVVGSGPGGEGAAMKAAKSRKRVAVVDDRSEVGGACTHQGTIPSKALRQAVLQLWELRQNPLLKTAAKALKPDLPALLAAAGRVVREQAELRRGFYEKNGVELIAGRARFASPHELEVRDAAGAALRLRAAAFVLATGARPYRPPEVDFSHPRVLDSDTLLRLKQTPGSLAIYGAGIIGCEYASIIRSLGVKVVLLNTRDRLLTFLDDEISDALSYHLRDQGVVIHHREEFAAVEPAKDRVVLRLKSGKRLQADYLLWANGRTGNTGGMGLEAIGVELDHRGSVKVDASYRTAAPHVYAVGDVVGPPALASAAYDQGRFAATHLVEGRCDERLARDIPAGIYTIPEISSVGRTERELTEARVPYEMGHAFFRSLARAQILGARVGMLKLLFHQESLAVLGVHCFGCQASEIVHIGQAVMSQKGAANSLLYFINTTFNYPTMAEAYRVAALNGYNRLRGIAPRVD